VRKPRAFPFYGFPEMDQWKAATPQPSTMEGQIQQRLGHNISTLKKPKDYFSDVAKHPIPFT